jgi:archaeal preflagellin peptidase FlaK
MNLQEIFAAARVTVTLVFLFYASWRDYKTREVSDKVWLIYGPIALALSLAELTIYAPKNLPFFGISVGLTVVLAFMLFFFGGFGGADTKAFVCIAFALPFFPTSLGKPIVPDGLSPLAQLIFPLTILTNAFLFSATSAIYLFFGNIGRRIITHKPLFEGDLAKEFIGKKFIVLITGHRLSISTLKLKWHKFPLEDIEEDGNSLKRKLLVVPHEEGNEQIVERLEKASKAGKISNKVWASPGLPMLIFVTAGFITALILGDLVWIFVARLLG